MGKSLYRKWQNTAKKQGSRIAIWEEDGSKLSFNELNEKVEERVAQLIGRTDWRNRIIAFQLINSAEWLVAFLTCQALEAIALPFDPDIPREGVEKTLESLGPAAFWNHNSIEHFSHPLKRAPACLIKMTSGSTGHSRPICFEIDQMLADGKQIETTMGIRPNDVNLVLIPFGHSYGLGNLIMPFIQLGVPLAICKDPFPYTLASTIKQTGATVVPTVPAILKALAYSDINPQNFNRVRLWISAGSPLAPNIAQQFHKVFGAHIHNFYGSSETGGIAYDRTGKDTLNGRSLGKPLKGVHVSLSPSKRLRVISQAVYTRGNRFKDDKLGSYLLADEAELLKDGSIVLHGRRGRIVKLGGKRVNLNEIERLLLKIAGIREVRVAEYTNPNGRTRLAAAIAPNQTGTTAKKALEAQLPKWKIPDRWLTFEAFPITPRGKTNYAELERRLRARPDTLEKP